MNRLLVLFALLMPLLFAAAPAHAVMTAELKKCSTGIFFGESYIASGDEPPWEQASTRVAASYSYETALDVCIGPNLYAYVKQNPWTAFDPDGLFEFGININNHYYGIRGAYLCTGSRGGSSSPLFGDWHIGNDVAAENFEAINNNKMSYVKGVVTGQSDGTPAGDQGAQGNAILNIAGGTRGLRTPKSPTGGPAPQMALPGGGSIPAVSAPPATAAPSMPGLPLTVNQEANGSPEASQKKQTKQNGALTEPNLPPKTVVKQNGVEIVHYTKSGDHGPPHLHVKGEGAETKIGQAGKPLDGSPALSAAQKTVVKESKSTIRKAVDQIGRWFRFNNAGGSSSK